MNAIVELLKLTTHKDDNVAVSAIRAVNAIMADQGLDWGSLMAETEREYRLERKQPPATKSPTPRTIDQMFKDLDSVDIANKKTEDFVESLKKHWKGGAGHLTEKQEDKLRLTHKNVLGL